MAHPNGYWLEGFCSMQLINVHQHVVEVAQLILSLCACNNRFITVLHCDRDGAVQCEYEIQRRGTKK